MGGSEACGRGEQTPGADVRPGPPFYVGMAKVEEEKEEINIRRVTENETFIYQAMFIRRGRARANWWEEDSE